MGPALQRAVVGRGAAYARLRQRRRSGPVDHREQRVRAALRNDNGNQNDMLRVKTVGTRSNRDGIGAKVTVKTKGTAPVRHGEDGFELSYRRASCRSPSAWASRERRARR